MTDTEILTAFAAIVVLGVAAQWIGRRLGFPSILLLLPAGLAAGASGIVKPEELFGATLFPLITLLVALLLFQAGLNLRLDDLPKPARKPVVRLVTVGLMVTFAGATATVALVTDMPRQVAFITGAILTVSGPTVVGPLLKVVRPRAPTGAVLSWEGVVLDPLGATLSVVVLDVILASGQGNGHLFLEMGIRLGLGAAIGLAGAAFLVLVLSRYLLTDDMEASAAVLVAVVCFTAAELSVSEAGLFATVVLGVAAANQRVVPTKRIHGFGETLEVFIIGGLFIVLGALVDIQDVMDNLGTVAVIVAILVLVVRPASVALSLIGTDLPMRDRALAAWMDPRGVVAAATAAQFSATLADTTFDSSLLSPVVFGVIIGTGVVYGLTASPAARLLRVQAPKPKGVALIGVAPWVRDLGAVLTEQGASVLLLTTDLPGRVGSDEDVASVSLLASDEALETAFDEAGLAEAIVASPEAAVVSLVVSELVERLGRSHVFVVPSRHDRPTRWRTEAWSPQPFAPDISLIELQTRVDAGGVVKVCPNGVPEGSIPLATVQEDGTVNLRPGLTREDPECTIIALVTDPRPPT